jgi:HD-GYP domain-containing protein (c-di-GMP phosphodiesterase class II)
MTNTAALLKEMGLYADALEVTDRALAFDRDSPRGRNLSLANAMHGLFSAHRLRDDAAALRYMKIGSEVLDDNPLADVVQKACFEYFRAMYLLSTDDHETAEILIAAAKKRAAGVRNSRVHILLNIASALCDWASREPARELRARKQLAELYHQSKQTRLHHDDVLRALIEVHKRTITGETAGIESRYGKGEVAPSLDAMTRIITSTAKTGIEYAKELVQYSAGPGKHADASREAMQYVGGVKNAKFYRQIRDRTEQREIDARDSQPSAYDPFSGVRAWLGNDDATPSVIADIGNPGVVAKPPADPANAVKKHDELDAIHGDMAQLRVDSLRAAMRTAAYDVAENWALAAEFFDDQTGEHCFRVGRLAGLLAAEIGIDPENCLRIEHASRLHDIGKIAVNELILLKPGPLDSHEIVAMRAHTEVGSQLLEHSSDATLKMAAAIAKYHHAWWNGAGYPNVAGENIPLAARICAYADVYDALTSERPYKRAWPHKLAVEQMLCESGAHFDPRLMQPFLKVLERHVGSNASMPSTRLHLADMEANGLLTSRRKLMSTVQAA